MKTALETLRELAEAREKATAGPWKSNEVPMHPAMAVWAGLQEGDEDDDGETHRYICGASYGDKDFMPPKDQYDANMKFIARAGSVNFPALLAEVEATRAENAELTATALRLESLVSQIRERRDDSNRLACQTLIAAIGSIGPENVEDAAKRAAATLAAKDAEVERLKEGMKATMDLANDQGETAHEWKAEAERLAAENAKLKEVVSEAADFLTSVPRIPSHEGAAASLATKLYAAVNPKDQP